MSLLDIFDKATKRRQAQQRQERLTRLSVTQAVEKSADDQLTEQPNDDLRYWLALILQAVTPQTVLEILARFQRLPWTDDERAKMSHVYHKRLQAFPPDDTVSEASNVQDFVDQLNDVTELDDFWALIGMVRDAGLSLQEKNYFWQTCLPVLQRFYEVIPNESWADGEPVSLSERISIQWHRRGWFIGSGTEAELPPDGKPSNDLGKHYALAKKIKSDWDKFCAEPGNKPHED